jgi:hypothetical protein
LAVTSGIVAAELGLADVLADGPRTVDQIAAATGTHAPSLFQLLRALTTIDLCRQREDGTFEMTPLGALLGTDVPGSLHSWARWSAAVLWPIWGRLLDSVKTGQSARKLLLGSGGERVMDVGGGSRDLLAALWRRPARCIPIPIPDTRNHRGRVGRSRARRPSRFRPGPTATA